MLMGASGLPILRFFKKHVVFSADSAIPPCLPQHSTEAQRNTLPRNIHR